MNELSEDIWFEIVEEIIGGEATDDGYFFAYENGMTPQQAVNLVVRG